MKDFLSIYILINLLAYGGAVGSTYKSIQDGTFDCDPELGSETWFYFLGGLAGFMAENSPPLNEAVKKYCEEQSLIDSL